MVLELAKHVKGKWHFSRVRPGTGSGEQSLSWAGPGLGVKRFGRATGKPTVLPAFSRGIHLQRLLRVATWTAILELAST